MRLRWFVLLFFTAHAAAQVQVITGSTQTGPAQQANIPSPQPTRPEDLCTVEGQAVSALTGEPLKKVQIMMNSLTAQNNSGRPDTHGTETDAGGRFVIEKLDPGRYNLSAERNGFVRFEFGARAPGRPGTPLVLDPGQHRRDLVFRLIPQGVITGKVVDEDGEPVENAQIRANRYAFVRGKRQLIQPGNGSTDDQGEYRVFGLEPGKYFLSAIYRQHNYMGIGVTQDRKPAAEASEGYAPTYYPGTNDPTAATTIQVSAGSVLGSVDIKLRKTRTVRIRGHIVNLAGEGSPRFAAVSLLPKDSTFFNPAARTTARPRDGAFEISDVVPGSYLLFVNWQAEGSRRTLRQPIEVGTSNLDDVNLVVNPPQALKGLIRVDGTAEVNLASLNVLLSPQGPMPMGGAFARVEGDGSLTFDSVSADVFSVLVRGLPAGFYVKSMRLGDADVLESGLDLTRGGSGVLEILINPNGGEIDGSVMNAQGQIAAGATVALVPDGKRRERTEFFQQAAIDTSGHFTLKGISPGDYKLFAWEDVEAGAYQDPEFLQPFENQGESVTIREGSRETRQLKLIPAESTPKNSGS